MAIRTPGAYLSAKFDTRKGTVMFARLFRRRRARRYVWAPALNFRHGGVIVALMTFGH